MPTRPAAHRSTGSLTFREAKRESGRQHDQRRGSSAERGYGSRWQKARALFLAEHPLCRMCQAIGRIEPATIVDHKEPHRGDPVLFWDLENWQPICQPHHDRDKQREEAQARRHRPT